MTGIKFDEIASKMHFKNMTDVIFDDTTANCYENYYKWILASLTVSAKIVKLSN